MTRENGQHFDGWETFDNRWDFTAGFLALLPLYIFLILLAIFVTFDGHFNDPVLGDFLFFLSIILITTLSIFLPMILYRIIVELRLIYGTYGKEIVFSDLDHLVGEVSLAIEGMGHRLGTVREADDIYHSAVPSFLRMISRVIEVAGTDIRILYIGPRDGRGWVFVGPISTEHPRLLNGLVGSIDGRSKSTEQGPPHPARMINGHVPV